MRKFLYILMFLPLLIQGQYMGYYASSGSGEAPPVSWSPLAISDVHASQVVRLKPLGGTRTTGFDISPDGHHFIAISDNPDFIGKYYLTEAHNLHTFAFTDTLSTGDTSGQDIKWKPDGTKFYHAEYGAQDGIHEWTLTTPFDITTATKGHWYNPSSNSEAAIEFNPDGTKMYVGTITANYLDTHDLTTAYDLTTASLNNRMSTLLATTSSTAHSLSFVKDGSELLYRDQISSGNENTIIQASLSTPYDLTSTITKIDSLDWGARGDRLYSFRWFEEHGYGMSVSWGEDYVFKMRQESDDTFESGKVYQFYNQTIPEIMPTSLHLNEVGNNFTFVVRVRLEAGMKPQANNIDARMDILGSKSSNYINFQYREESQAFFTQVYNGVSGQASGNYIYLQGLGIKNDGEWMHLAWSHTSGVNDKFYIDGVLVDTGLDTDCPGLSTLAVDQTLFIGGRENGGYYMDGDISDVQVYTKVLSDAEILALSTDMDNVPTDYATSCIADWGDNKGKYFWKDDTGNGHYAGVESIERRDYNVNDGQFRELYFPEGDACSLINEGASIAAWTAGRSASIYLSSLEEWGDYALQVVAGAESYSNATITLTGLEVGATYTVWCKARSDVYNQQNIHLPISGGWTTNEETAVNATGYAYFSVTGTTNSTSANFVVRASDNLVGAGEQMWIDGIWLEKHD